MKKRILPIIVALMLPFACTQVEEPAIGPTADDGQILVISANSSSVTRTVLNEDNSVSFLDTDALLTVTATAFRPHRLPRHRADEILQPHYSERLIPAQKQRIRSELLVFL